MRDLLADRHALDEAKCFSEEFWIADVDGVNHAQAEAPSEA